LSIWPELWRHLLPQDCLLCGDGPAEALLCDRCLADLPRVELPCPVCGETAPTAQTCGSCLSHPPTFDATRAAFRYAFPADKLVQALKYQHRLAVAGFLAEAMLAGGVPAGELLLPLPLSSQRLRQRGFNQAVEIARVLARATGLPLELTGCWRSHDTRPQAMLPWQARRRNVRGAFGCHLDLNGRTVIVIDDVMTSGATLEEFAGTLKARGAERVHNWVACRAVRSSAGG
jgi:ComF family protein